MNCQEFQRLLGQELKKVRISKGLKRNEVFLDTNIQIGRIEDGKIGFSTSTYWKICDYYGIDYDFIYKRVELLRKNISLQHICLGFDGDDG